ncbi:hypothetical protein QBC37DRAFT_150531 [Rhypophila decipiens]|uniref:Nephrocystin 3-like N-terminal domain-containing protein n=1 Tax=Rhypophila decipiens TaxID=261697 RepID=A0AAN6Y8N1_9PEZI|nr:hypothetical protein QBC37DRAFT_150531 [Rhypophila decipiens]
MMSDADEKDIRSTISGSRFRDHARIQTGKFVNNVTFNLSSEGDSHVNELNTEFLKSLGSINSFSDKLFFESVYTGISTYCFDWVFELQKYKDWETGRGAPVLWVQDVTGSGHTLLTLRLLNQLRLLEGQDQGTTNAAPPMVAFCFCQQSAGPERTIACVLQGLLSAFLQQDTNLLTRIRQKYSNLFQESAATEKKEHFMFLGPLTDTLEELSTRSCKIYLVINGIDELASGPRSHNALQILRSLLLQFPGLRWIITSRVPPPRLWTTVASGHPVSELVLSSIGVATALGLNTTVESISEFGTAFGRIYMELSGTASGNTDCFSSFEHTIKGRNWLTDNDLPTSSRVVWYSTGGETVLPSDLGLQVLQETHRWKKKACLKAYFSFTFIQSLQLKRNSALNPIPALWCLFTQLACQAYPSQDALASFLVSLETPLQRWLRDIFSLNNILAVSRWLAQRSVAESTAVCLYSEARASEKLRGWIPFEEWEKMDSLFLDESSSEFLISIIRGLIASNDHSLCILVIDSMHLADIETWKNRLGPFQQVFHSCPSARLFLTGTYGLEQVSELKSNALLPDPIDEHTEYRECLNTLYFENIHSRREKVQEAFLDTNQWIWQHSDYKEWKTDGGLLWISGKAGSGKSVLAKTIQQKFLGHSHEEKDEGKGPWSVCDWFYSRRDHTVGVAHDSMLRGLLYDMLHQREELFDIIRLYYRNAWNSLYEPGKSQSWPIKDLEGMLRALSESPLTSRTLAIIDGLDESETGLKKRQILRLLVEICSLGSGSIRIIALSRPEPTIEESFSQCLQISMQQNNTQDIARIIDAGLHTIRYIWTRATNLEHEALDSIELEEDMDTFDGQISNWLKFVPRREVSLRPDEERELGLIRGYLVHHSDGVTLWARLVLEQLLGRMTNTANSGFSLLDLRRILKTLPTELDELYGHILSTAGLDPGSPKLATAKRMFRWILGSKSWEPLQLQDFLDAMATPENHDGNYGDCEDPIFLRRYQIGDNWNRLWKIIFDHCGTLVELVETGPQRISGKRPERVGRRLRKAEPNWTLQVIHQTVKSFLEGNSAHNRMRLTSEESERTVLDGSYRYLSIVLPKHKADYLPAHHSYPINSPGIVCLRDFGDWPPFFNMSYLECEEPEKKALSEAWIPWLDYLSRRPFTRYALRVLQKNARTSSKNWIMDSLFRGQNLNHLFPLWWVVTRYITTGGEHHLCNFVRYACGRGDTIPLEILIRFIKLFEEEYFGKGVKIWIRGRLNWSFLYGAAEMILERAVAHPSCGFPIDPLLLQEFPLYEEDNDEPLNIASPRTAALIHLLELNSNSPQCAAKDHFHNASPQTIESSRSGTTAGLNFWKMDQAIALVLDFLRESMDEVPFHYLRPMTRN